MERYKTKFSEGTLLVFEELIQFYNESADIEILGKGLVEALNAFLTVDEIQEVMYIMRLELDDEEV